MKEKELNISIVRMVSLPEHTDISHWEIMRYNGTPVKVDMEARMHRPLHDRIEIELTATYTTVRGMLRRTLLEFSSLTEFAIEGLDDVSDFEGGDALLPAGLTSMLMGVALGGLRGMIAAHTANTFLVHYPLPLYNIHDLLSKIGKPENRN